MSCTCPADPDNETQQCQGCIDQFNDTYCGPAADAWEAKR